MLVLSGFLFLVFYALTSFGKENTKLFDPIQIGVETILILVFSYYYLYERMNDTSTLFIYSTYAFWIMLGIVLSLSGSLFVYIFTNYLSKEDLRQFWALTNFLSILRSIFFTVAIYINAKPPKNQLPTNPNDFELSSLN